MSITTTNAAAGVTAAAGTFAEEDAGRTVTGTGIPAGATLASVTSDTVATLSANATASGARTVTIGAGSGQVQGFRGWSPESDEESERYSVSAFNAGQVPPDRITNTHTAAPRRARS